MFPQGVWSGFWSYHADGADMIASAHPLTLTFGPETVHGGGTDSVGTFTVAGAVAGDRIDAIKQYSGMHAIGYLGRLGFRGCVVGWWRFGERVGGRFIWVPPGAADVAGLVAAYERTLRE